ncbi:beta-ketoacyl-ACP synthase [Paraferrimonas haliotis]|uniref:Beta-ketoacyl-[acyl-carrier-protein] synthase II n=1 Tax=Paraferrimonas haliotis TaxID=2013866 RepID=A0AA37WW27_9GAMM|nr:beta-ketoacyl-ACP synthase [Paraferrimonas haliotis]GLS83163.1 beta-ketoacyl-[acyl-carrier-protein] synthase II [Paraferrimonas haliotis]
MYIEQIGAISALGRGKQATLDALASGESKGMARLGEPLYSGRFGCVASIVEELPPVPTSFRHWDNRNNRIAAACFEQIQQGVERAISSMGAHRIGVVIGTSTCGIAEGEKAIRHFQQHRQLPDDFQFSHQDIGNSADFIAKLAQVDGPRFSISTACSSAARTFISAQKLLQTGVCDAVICGGVDSYCDLTVNGFDALEQVSSDPCMPFSSERRGINIGEAGALFLCTREPAALYLAGWGESAEGHHMSAPLPSGEGAQQAMQQALTMANLSAADIGYVNAHGTATQLNDAMESKAISELLGDTPVSSTKALTGHCLGAAAAIEAAICCWSLEHQTLPQQFPRSSELDPECSPINLVKSEQALTDNFVISNSFAFGGNNAALIFGVTRD